MKLVAAILGVSLAAGLVIHFDLPEIVAALAASGWGVAGVTAYHIVSLLFAALAWKSLVDRRWPQPLRLYLFARLAREGANNLLPMAQVGGELIGARLLMLKGASGTTAAASVIVDLTVETLAQILFTALGLVVLALLGMGAGIFGWLVVGLAAAAALVVGFLVAQRFGLFRLLGSLFERPASERGWSGLGTMAGLHEEINAMYGDRRRAIAAGAWHLAAWVFGAGEIWIAFHAMGIPIEVAEAIALESLVQAVRSAAFFVPLGLGVQEGGFVVAGALFGIGPEAALGVALIKRARDLVLGVPALLIWQAIEGRRWAAVRARSTENADET